MDHSYSSKFDDDTLVRTINYCYREIAELSYKLTRPRPRSVKVKLQRQKDIYMILKDYCRAMRKFYAYSKEKNYVKMKEYAKKAKQLFKLFEKKVRTEFVYLPLDDVKGVIINFSYVFKVKNELLDLFCI